MNAKEYERERKIAYSQWRETVVADFLRRRGYLIVDNRSKPIVSRPRATLDLVAWEERSDTMVFIRVSGTDSLYDRYYCTHYKLRRRQQKNRYSDIAKVWMSLNKWHGKWQLAEARVFGSFYGGRPVIEFIRY
jgi:Holliday junction resolvase-like predicted endonuclease